MCELNSKTRIKHKSKQNGSFSVNSKGFQSRRQKRQVGAGRCVSVQQSTCTARNHLLSIPRHRQIWSTQRLLADKGRRCEFLHWVLLLHPSIPRTSSIPLSNRRPIVLTSHLHAWIFHNSTKYIWEWRVAVGRRLSSLGEGGWLAVGVVCYSFWRHIRAKSRRGFFAAFKRKIYVWGKTHCVRGKRIMKMCFLRGFYKFPPRIII